MSLLAHLGNNVYSGHAEYDNLSGRVVMETARYVYIDIGRPDPVTPAEVDAALDRERLPGTSEAHADAYAARYDERMARMVDLLTAHGPLSVTEVAKRLGLAASTVRMAVRACDGEVVELGRVGNGIWVGVPGQTMPVSALTPNLQAALAYLREHGPSTAQEMAAHIGCDLGRLMEGLRGSDLVVSAGQREIPSKYRTYTAQLYALAMHGKREEGS